MDLVNLAELEDHRKTCEVAFASLFERLAGQDDVDVRTLHEVNGWWYNALRKALLDED